MRYDKSTNSDNNKVHAFKAIVFGSCVGALVCILLLVLCSFAFVKMQSISQNIIQTLVVAISGIGAFIGAYITVRIAKVNGMFYGILSAALLFSMLFIAGIIANGENVTTITLVKLTLMLLLGAISGIIGVNKKRRKLY